MHLPFGTKRAITLPAIAAVLALLGASSAVADGRPKATMVTTRFLDVMQKTRHVTTCTGQDALPYEELRQTFVGTSVADDPPLDPNLTGDLFIRCSAQAR